MEEEEDVYVSQLREVFQSCDLTGKGHLNRSELIDLCQRLQLDDQIPALLTECIGDEISNGKVCLILYSTIGWHLYPIHTSLITLQY